VVINKATSISAGSARRTATRDAVVFLHGHQLERNAARAAAAEAAGTFVLVLAITSAAVAAALARPVAGAPYGSLAVPVVGGLGLAIAVAGLDHISGAHLNPAVTLGLAVNRQFPWAYVPGYVLAQVADATAAAAVTRGLYGNQARSIAYLGATAPAAGVSAVHPPCRIFAAPLALASTRWRVQISHFGAVQVRPGVSAFWWRSCLAVPGTRLAAGLGA
jgi:glycerol uptake facilitator-like aquaporin